MQDVRRLPEFAELAAVPKRRAVVRGDVLVGVLLLMVMLVGGYFRFAGLNWDDFTHLHPDERFLTDVAQGLGKQLNPSGDNQAEHIATCLARYPDTNGMGTYFDSYCSTLNPLNANSTHGLFVYGTLPLFMAKAAGDLMVQGSEFVAHNILRQPGLQRGAVGDLRRHSSGLALPFGAGGDEHHPDQLPDRRQAA